MKKYSAQERLDYILDTLENLNHVTIDDFAEKLEVATQTIRRDIAKLEERGLVIKYHGGILSLARDIRENYALRQTDHLDAKKIMSRLCLDIIGDSSSLFMTIGTTLEVFAKDLVKQRVNINVITNSIKNANILIDNSSFNVSTPCGSIRNYNGGVSGTEASEFLNSFRMDYVVLSAGSIGMDGYILDYNIDECKLAKQMIQQSEQSILLIDHTKFCFKANVVLAPLSDIDILITNQEPPKEYIDLCKEANCRLIYPQ